MNKRMSKVLSAILWSSFLLLLGGCWNIGGEVREQDKINDNHQSEKSNILKQAQKKDVI